MSSENPLSINTAPNSPLPAASGVAADVLNNAENPAFRQALRQQLQNRGAAGDQAVTLPADAVIRSDVSVPSQGLAQWQAAIAPSLAGEALRAGKSDAETGKVLPPADQPTNTDIAADAAAAQIGQLLTPFFSSPLLPQPSISQKVTAMADGSPSKLSESSSAPTVPSSGDAMTAGTPASSSPDPYGLAVSELTGGAAAPVVAAELPASMNVGAVWSRWPVGAPMGGGRQAMAAGPTPGGGTQAPAVSAGSDISAQLLQLAIGADGAPGMIGGDLPVSEAKPAVEAAQIQDLARLTANDAQAASEPFAAQMQTMSAESRMPVGEALPSLERPVGHPQWSQELGDRIAWIAGQRQGMQSAELKLNPAHLGPMEVRIDIRQDQASIQFMSHHAAVREAIEASLPMLRDMLQAQSLNLVDVSVGQHAGQSTERDPRSPQFGFDQQSRSGQGGAGEMPDRGTVHPESEPQGRTVSRGLLSLYA